MDNKDSFNYTYSAKQQEEIKNIRKKYLPAEEDKMEYLRRLDSRVSRKANVMSLIVGILGAMILGVGMCCVLVWEGVWFIPGIVIGVVGIAVTCLAYPIYKHMIIKEREKIAPEILRITDELMK